MVAEPSLLCGPTEELGTGPDPRSTVSIAGTVVVTFDLGTLVVVDVVVELGIVVETVVELAIGTVVVT